MEFVLSAKCSGVTRVGQTIAEANGCKEPAILSQSGGIGWMPPTVDRP